VPAAIRLPAVLPAHCTTAPLTPGHLYRMVLISPLLPTLREGKPHSCVFTFYHPLTSPPTFPASYFPPTSTPTIAPVAPFRFNTLGPPKASYVSHSAIELSPLIQTCYLFSQNRLVGRLTPTTLSGPRLRVLLKSSIITVRVCAKPSFTHFECARPQGLVRGMLGRTTAQLTPLQPPRGSFCVALRNCVAHP